MKPWENEPDLEIFMHENYICMIRRIERLCHLTGYVGVTYERLIKSVEVN